MRTIAMLQITIVALVLGALALTDAYGADEPKPINIVSANLKRGLTPSDIQQVKAHAEYWVDSIGNGETAGAVYSARESILADYDKYGKSIRYQVEFARSTAAKLPAAMKRLSIADRLKSLKEINYAIVISEMAQLTAIDAIDSLVGHANPGVRFLAWRGYRGIRDDAIVAGKEHAEKLFNALKKRAGVEPSPLVAAVIVDVLHIKESAWTTNAFKKAFEGNFKTLIVMLKPCCNRLAAGEASWARPCIAAIPILQSAAEFYKPDTKMTTVILQHLINIAQAGAKAYAAAKAVGPEAFRCIPLLLQVEPAIGSLTDHSEIKEIRGPLLDKKKGPDEKTRAIRRGVLEWIDRLEDLGVKTPVFTPIKTSAATTQPVKTAN